MKLQMLNKIHVLNYLQIKSNNPTFRILGACFLGVANLVSPFVLEFAGVPYFLVLRIIKGVSQVKKNYVINLFNQTQFVADTWYS